MSNSDWVETPILDIGRQAVGTIREDANLGSRRILTGEFKLPDGTTYSREVVLNNVGPDSVSAGEFAWWSYSGRSHAPTWVTFGTPMEDVDGPIPEGETKKVVAWMREAARELGVLDTLVYQARPIVELSESKDAGRWLKKRRDVLNLRQRGAEQ